LNKIKLFESFALLSIIFFFLPKSFKKLSDIMIWLLVLFTYVPMLTLFAFMDRSRAYMYAVTGFWVLIFILLKLPAIRLPQLKKNQSEIITYSIFIGISSIVFFMIYRYFDFSINFNLNKVYQIRKAFINEKIPLSGYLFNWSAYIINPIFFAVFLRQKKWIPVILIIVIQILIFSSTGNKTFLFGLPFVFILILLIKQQNPFPILSFGFSFIVFVGMLIYWLTGNQWIYFLFTRRSLLLPARLSFIYYDFFSKNVHVFLSQHHLFRNFIDYPYQFAPAYLIGETYFNDAGINATNGIYADAFMNFGYAGFAIWGIVLALILKIMDSLSEKKDLSITVAAIAMPAIIIGETALLTGFVTHGIFLSLLLLYLLPKKEGIVKC
jgi:hypothetical protein